MKKLSTVSHGEPRKNPGVDSSHHPQRESSPADMLSLSRLTCNQSLIFSPWDVLHCGSHREPHISFLNFH